VIWSTCSSWPAGVCGMRFTFLDPARRGDSHVRHRPGSAWPENALSEETRRRKRRALSHRNQVGLARRVAGGRSRAAAPACTLMPALVPVWGACGGAAIDERGGGAGRVTGCGNVWVRVTVPAGTGTTPAPRGAGPAGAP
jgi:hypothetical protein